MIIEILAIIILVGMSAFFSGSETSLVSVNRFKVNLFLKENRAGSQSLQKVKEYPHRMISTLLICNNIVNISASVLATKVALNIFSNNALAYATGIMTFIIIVFGEVIPKSLATAYFDRLALIVAPVIYFLMKILYPLVIIFDFITIKIFKIKFASPKIAEEEVRSIVDIAKEEGGIDKEEKEWIHRIFKFDDIDVDAIKLPRTDMKILPKKSKLKDAIRLISEKGLSRVPIYDGFKDNIVGIFYFKDALQFINKKNYDVPIENLMRKPLFIPETKKLDETLKLFQRKKQQMAIIIDEHGGVSGLITMEDILEEIVGEIQDETEKVTPQIKKIGKNTFQVLGKTELEDVNKALMVKFKESEDYDTISGYVLNKFGKIPLENEEIDLPFAKIIVDKVEGNRIIELTIKKKR